MMKEFYMNNYNIFNSKLTKATTVISTLLFPVLCFLYVVSINSTTLINDFLSKLILVLAVFTFLLSLIGCIFTFSYNNKSKMVFKVIYIIFIIIYFACFTVGLALLYIPSLKFRDFLITSAMTTMTHQRYAQYFYDDYTIQLVLDNNKVIESDEDTNPDLIVIDNIDFNNISFKNKYDKEILTKDKGNDIYKIINISRGGFKGKLAVIYDPSKISIASSKGVGTDVNKAYGQYIETISKDNNALIAMNGSGFYDPDYNSMGGVPHGIVISNGKLVADNAKGTNAGGVIGFNKENKLILAKMTADEALKSGIRDCVEFGPFLIVNGKSSFIEGNGGYGYAPRSAIAQRKDGIVLFLVIDGRQPSSIGADMNDLVDVLLDYGAYNAANLDGGTSTVMTLNGKLINNPVNGSLQKKDRPIPNAFIVTK